MPNGRRGLLALELPLVDAGVVVADDLGDLVLPLVRDVVLVHVGRLDHVVVDAHQDHVVHLHAASPISSSQSPRDLSDSLRQLFQPPARVRGRGRRRPVPPDGPVDLRPHRGGHRALGPQPRPRRRRRRALRRAAHATRRDACPADGRLPERRAPRPAHPRVPRARRRRPGAAPGGRAVGRTARSWPPPGRSSSAGDELDLPDQALDHPSPFDPAAAPPLDEPNRAAATTVGRDSFDSSSLIIEYHAGRGRRADPRSGSASPCPSWRAPSCRGTELAAVAADYAQAAVNRQLPLRRLVVPQHRADHPLRPRTGGRGSACAARASSNPSAPGSTPPTSSTQTAGWPGRRRPSSSNGGTRAPTRS